MSALFTFGGVAGGAALGVLPGVIARKTFLAPVPDAGLGDLGPSLMALGIGAAGAVVGAIVGFLVTTRWYRQRSAPMAGSRVVGVAALLLVALPLAGIVFLIFPLGGLALFAVLLVVAATVSFRPTRERPQWSWKGRQG